ncbi:hypothetical protein CPn_0070 [Chlamydia pneumoniae CWL029]|uniref:Uncharacterized protein n=2 Tax=Chlamydia pneumoniae TaxID=83558 RepID=A0A0H2UL51_CHLPN|nr:hypothetical protein CPn_0070 [Chlamydia pneumoniae CWL029]
MKNQNFFSNQSRTYEQRFPKVSPHFESILRLQSVGFSSQGTLLISFRDTELKRDLYI